MAAALIQRHAFDVSLALSAVVGSWTASPHWLLNGPLKDGLSLGIAPTDQWLSDFKIDSNELGYFSSRSLMFLNQHGEP
jgi:hypothetical protein